LKYAETKKTIEKLSGISVGNVFMTSDIDGIFLSFGRRELEWIAIFANIDDIALMHECFNWGLRCTSRFFTSEEKFTFATN
jgi:hypothetical protein